MTLEEATKQIEDMKCCGNCVYWYRECDGIMSCNKNPSEFEVKRNDSCSYWKDCL